MNHSKITVKSLGRMEKHAPYPEAVHCCNNFLPNLPTFADPRHNELGPAIYGYSDGGHCTGKAFLSDVISFVQVF